MVRRVRENGFSLMQTIVVLSIIASLAVLASPTIGRTKRETRVAQCQEQMHELGMAITAYRNQHHERSPDKLSDLVPRYIDNANVLICPFANSIAPASVRQAVANSRRRGREWSTYFYFSQKALDDLAARGKIPFGYSDVLNRRGGDTPLVICRDHREPFSLNPTLGMEGAQQTTFADPSIFPKWFLPEEPIVLLRYDGRVQKIGKGGTLTRHTAGSTQQDLDTL